MLRFSKKKKAVNKVKHDKANPYKKEVSDKGIAKEAFQVIYF